MPRVGRWRKGESGNPSGRPPGLPDRRRELRELIRPHVPELVEKALDMARAGDPAALRLLLDRALPPLKPSAEPVAVPLDPSAPLPEQGAAILQAVAAGTVPPDVGKALLEALAAQGRLLELHELARRVAALESAREGASDD